MAANAHTAGNYTDYSALTSLSAAPIDADVVDYYYQRKSFISPPLRLQCLTAIREFVLSQQALPKSTLGKLVELAEHLCDWHLVNMLSAHAEHIDADLAKLFAYANWKLGNWEQAYNSLQRQMFKHPRKQMLYRLYIYLLDNSAHQGLTRYSHSDIAPRLSLEPLNYHHCQEFLWQYWDSRIAQLCSLPDIDNEYDWSLWLQEQHSFGDQSTFAVQHQDWGFIGVVSLIVHDQVGFFYFWLGQDFRCQGLGTEAAALLLNLGEDYFGINCCYAKVFEHNTGSQKAMYRLGFKALPFRAAPPNENERLFYRGPTKSVKQNSQEAAAMFAKMASLTQVEMPLSWYIELADQFACKHYPKVTALSAHCPL